jgi:membrane-associated protein
VDPKHLIEAFGTVGILAIIFAESGLLFGFFLPGDSLLFTAGILCAPRNPANVHLNLAVVLVGCFLAAVAGAEVGYVIGSRAGPALFRRPDSRFFRQDHLERAREFFAEHGTKTVILGRFVPFVRTFVTVVAGIGRMDRRLFSICNVVGAFLWAVGVTLLGYWLGRTIHNVDRYLLPIIGVILLASFVPVGRELLKARRARAAATQSDV